MTSSRARKTIHENELDAVFSALADPTRRRIVSELARGPSSVSELAEPFAMTLPAVSKHLRVLERAGIVASERDGRFVRCRLEGQALGEADAFLARYRSFWQSNLDQLAAYLEAEETESKAAPKKRKR